MAIVGAIIIEHIIFKANIELGKITFIDERLKNALPPKTRALRHQIAIMDTAVNAKQ